MPQYHTNLVWNTMWIEFLFANHYKDVMPFKNSKQYKIIFSRLVSPGMISTSTSSYTVTFTCILYHFLSQSEGFSATAEEQGDLTAWRVNTWDTLSSWSRGGCLTDTLQTAGVGICQIPASQPGLQDRDHICSSRCSTNSSLKLDWNNTGS